MPITFTLDDENNVTWESPGRGTEVTHQEAAVMAAVMTARANGAIADALYQLSQAVEYTKVDDAIEKVAEALASSSPKVALKRKPKIKKGR